MTNDLDEVSSIKCNIELELVYCLGCACTCMVVLLCVGSCDEEAWIVDNHLKVVKW